MINDRRRIGYYYRGWRQLRDVKVGVVGEEWSATRKVLHELWMAPIPAWGITSQNIQYLGKKHLPTLGNSTDYDILLLVDWNVDLNWTEGQKLLENFRKGCGIVVVSTTLCELYMIDQRMVQFIFGIKNVYSPRGVYSNLTYSTQHFVTSDFSIPFNSTEAESGVPVSNLTTAQGIAEVTASDELYLLVTNQRGTTRTAHFGIKISEMTEEDLSVFKKVLLWTLNLEAYLR